MSHSVLPRSLPIFLISSDLSVKWIGFIEISFLRDSVSLALVVFKSTKFSSQLPIFIIAFPITFGPVNLEELLQHFLEDIFYVDAV